VSATENTTIKNHPRKILCKHIKNKEKPNTQFKKKKLSKVEIWSASLTHYGCKPRDQTKQRTAMMWDVPFGVPTSVLPLRLVFSINFHVETISKC